MGDSSLARTAARRVLSPRRAFPLCKRGEESREGWTHHIAATGRLGRPGKSYDNIENFIGTSPLSSGEVARTATNRR